MGKYRVVAGQNIYDVALYLYGSIEGVVDLLINNPDLSFATTLTAGRELVYTDDFVIRADVVAYNGLHGIVPANGERHVYPKTFTLPLAVVLTLAAGIITVQCAVSGAGQLEIDWGDNSDTETVLSIARKHMCQLAVLKFQQIDGLNTVLPIGTRKIISSGPATKVILHFDFPPIF